MNLYPCSCSLTLYFSMSPAVIYLVIFPVQTLFAPTVSHSPPALFVPSDGQEKDDASKHGSTRQKLSPEVDNGGYSWEARDKRKKVCFGYWRWRICRWLIDRVWRHLDAEQFFWRKVSGDWNFSESRRCPSVDVLEKIAVLEDKSIFSGIQYQSVLVCTFFVTKSCNMGNKSSK